ncbi:heme-dependent oxidative N-demethylase family protein [Mesorhizobium sp. A556]
MTNLPAHTPYDGSSKLFTIGLKPLDLDNWIEVDEHHSAHLAEKRRLYAKIPEKILVAEAGTQAAQQEVLDLVTDHMRRHFPDVSRAALPDQSNWPASQPIYAASLLVQEDLILMRRSEQGWRLVAGSLCFPSSWSLVEKFGKPLQEIHIPVPGFGPGSRPDLLIARMFDALQIDQPLERYNWSIQAGDALYQPLSDVERDERATSRPSRYPNGDIAAHAFIRVERQTLRKLPASKDILFTIRIHLDPLKVLAKHPERATLAATFAEQLSALDEKQLDYKGMTADRDRLVALLQGMAGAD